MTLLKEKLIEGEFLSEIKNRFLCKVSINNLIHECYVPSSSRLENYLNLKNKKVLLTINKGKDTRTKYSVFAVKYRNKYIILNLHYANKLFEPMLKEAQYSEYNIHGTYRREINVEGYKSDFFYEGSKKIIIENKSIISTANEVLFPGAYSSRGIEQLKILKILLQKGYLVNYNLISLSPFVKKVKINPNISEFRESFLRCIENGMKVYGYNLCFSYNDMTIKCNNLNVIIE